MKCEMIVNHTCDDQGEITGDIECGKPVTRSWEQTPCCEDCYQACAEQEARDEAARASLLPGDSQVNP